jgi:hypothetical protein
VTAPARRTRPRTRLFDVADRAGAFVTLVAIVVLGLMIGSAFPGTPDTARSTLTVTFDR